MSPAWRTRISCLIGHSRALPSRKCARSAARTGARRTGKSSELPRPPDGGWLILDKPFQDVQFASTYRCTGGCRAGVMLRAQKSRRTAFKGVYVQLPDGQNPAASFALKLDAQGREVSRDGSPAGERNGSGPRPTPAGRPGRPGCRRRRPGGPGAPGAGRQAGQRRAKRPSTGGPGRTSGRRTRALAADCLRILPSSVRTIPTSRTSGTRSKPSWTPTIFAHGSTMDRKAEPRTAGPTTT